jgi:hypothetical protein
MIADNAGKAVVVFDPETDVVMGTVALPTGGTIVGDCAITPDLSVGFVTDFDFQVWVIDLSGPAPALAEGTNPIVISNPGEDLAISPDGQYLVVCDGGFPYPVSVVDIATRAEIGTFDLAVPFKALDIAPDGSVIVASGFFGDILRLLLDAAGVLTDTGESLPFTNPFNVYAAPGGSHGIVLGGAPELLSFGIPGMAALDTAALATGVSGFAGAFHPDGNRFYSLTRDAVNLATLIAWPVDPATGVITDTPLFAVPLEVRTIVPFGIDSITVHPAGSKLYVSRAGEVDILDPETGADIGGIVDPAIVDPQGICIVRTTVDIVPDAGGPYSVDEGDTVMVSATVADAGGQTITYAWDLDNDGTFETPGQTALYLAVEGPETRTIAVRATTSGGASGEDTATVEIANVAPNVGPIDAPADPVLVRTEIAASADFFDPGVLDTHTAVWDWGDGAQSDGTVVETNGSGVVSGTHVYEEAGVYMVEVMVTDDDGGAGSSVFESVIVIDPQAGFITGAGSIDSPPGALWPLDAPAPTDVAGEAKFNINLKYQGDTSLSGNIQFRLQAAKMLFRSEMFDWLVLDDSTVTCMGAGSLNDAGGFAFLMSASEEAPGTFRMVIWEEAGGQVVYDNQRGDDLMAPATQPIVKGNIAIHTEQADNAKGPKNKMHRALR